MEKLKLEVKNFEWIVKMKKIQGSVIWCKFLYMEYN